MTPRQAFEDSFRIADLMIHVFRLLENERVETAGEQVEAIRRLLGCERDEELQLIANAVFFGCIRESAHIPSAHLKRQSLENLLRQAIVSACTAYEVFLSRTLQVHLPWAIRVSRAGAIPSKGSGADYFRDLVIPAREVLNLLDRDDRWEAMANKIWNFVKNRNLASVEAIDTVGSLLGIPDAWRDVCRQLKKDPEKAKEDVRDALKRRHAIVHNADRNRDSEGLEKTPINFAWAQQSVDTIKHVCLAFDEIVNRQMKLYREQLDATSQEAAHA